jgi:hypothetical protein
LTEAASKAHGRVIDLVREVLNDRRPRMVAPDETFITGERDDVCILVIPHRWLGGAALVVVSTVEVLDLRWAGVTDLSDHDQIDLGHVVKRWSVKSAPVDQLRDQLLGELTRPIEWSCEYLGGSARPKRIRASLNVDGKRVDIGIRTELSLWPFRGRRIVEQTTLSAEEPPAFRMAVPIERLLEQP